MVNWGDYKNLTISPEDDVFQQPTSWKNYYAKVVKTIAVLKEKHGFTYLGGNPFLQLNIIEAYPPVTPLGMLLYYGIHYEDLSLVAYVLNRDVKLMDDIFIQRAANLPDKTILKYILSRIDINKFSVETQNLVKSSLK